VNEAMEHMGFADREVDDNKLEFLGEAFESFIAQTQKLRQTHLELKEQVEEINADLEEKNRALEAKIDELHETEEYLNNTLESVSSGVVAVDLDGKVTIFNRGAEMIMRTARDDVIGQDYCGLFGGGQPMTPAIMDTLHNHKSVVNRQRLMKLKDGTEIIIQASTAPIRNARGEIIGAIETFSDLTEIVELEEQIRRADRLAVIGEMAATVAHEIRNPLGGIEGFALLLEKDVEDNEQLRDRARNIVDGARTINSIISRMLEFARPLDLNLQHEHIDKIIDDTLMFVKEEDNDGLRSICVEKRYETGSGVLADRSQLREVFSNLIQNAVQAMPGGGDLKIAIKEAESGIEIKMQDSGCGIPEDVATKLFNPFFTTREHAAGLGLSTVQKIICAHRGAINVESKIGEGTTFTINLPSEKGA
jgi:PAS domain S-box-containing protein